jgi:hypothetical protein
MLKYAALVAGCLALSAMSAEARISANGISLNGISLNGVSLNGISLNGTQADLRAPNAQIPQSGMRVISVELPGHDGQ